MIKLTKQQREKLINETLETYIDNVDFDKVIIDGFKGLKKLTDEELIKFFLELYLQN